MICGCFKHFEASFEHFLSYSKPQKNRILSYSLHQQLRREAAVLFDLLEYRFKTSSSLNDTQKWVNPANAYYSLLVSHTALPLSADWRKLVIPVIKLSHVLGSHLNEQKMTLINSRGTGLPSNCTRAICTKGKSGITR